MNLSDKFKISQILLQVPNWELISSYLDYFGEPKVSIVRILQLKSLLLDPSDFPNVWMPVRDGKPEIYSKRGKSRGAEGGKFAKNLGKQHKSLRSEIISGSQKMKRAKDSDLIFAREPIERKPNSPIYVSPEYDDMQLGLNLIFSKFDPLVAAAAPKQKATNQSKRSFLAREVNKKFSHFAHPAKRYRIIADIMEWRVRYELLDNAPAKKIYTDESVRKYIERRTNK